MPCDSGASEPGEGVLWGVLAERRECAQERPLSFATLRYFLAAEYGQNWASTALQKYPEYQLEVISRIMNNVLCSVPSSFG